MVVLGGTCFLQFLLSTVCVNHFQKRFFFLSTFVWYRCGSVMAFGLYDDETKT
jgi:hypothetical protein